VYTSNRPKSFSVVLCYSTQGDCRVTMGNRNSSTGKQNPDGVTGKRRFTSNGTHSAQNNDKSNVRTKADEIVDQRPSLNLTMYRSVSQRDQVTIMFTIQLWFSDFVVQRSGDKFLWTPRSRNGNGLLTGPAILSGHVIVVLNQIDPKNSVFKYLCLRAGCAAGAGAFPPLPLWSRRPWLYR